METVTIELTEEEREFLHRVCTRARLNLFAGQLRMTPKLEVDSAKLDRLTDKLLRKPDLSPLSGG